MSMNKRVLKIFLISLCSICWLAQMNTTARQNAVAQTTAATDAPVVERDSSGRVRVRIERGNKVFLGNRTTGRITVTGWDGDTIEAIAVSERGTEMVRVWTDSTSSGTVLALKADYADSDSLQSDMLEMRREGAEIRREAMEARRAERQERREEREMRSFELPQMPPASNMPPTPNTTPTPQPSPTPVPTPALPAQMSMALSRPFEIHLEVKLPRNTEIDVIKVVRSDVEVTGITTPLTISGDRSSIVLKQVGAVEVRTRSGNVQVEQASGLVDVVTTSGSIRVKNAGADVRALSINGAIEIRCARGRVDVANTDGPIELVRVGGDVDANAANSSVHFTGAVRQDGRYYLKSMSGSVEMTLPANNQGFTAALSTYRGTIENDFPLKIKQSSESGALNHRTVGRFGDGRAQITLDSFEGLVKLSRVAPNAMSSCN